MSRYVRGIPCGPLPVSSGGYVTLPVLTRTRDPGMVGYRRPVCPSRYGGRMVRDGIPGCPGESLAEKYVRLELSGIYNPITPWKSSVNSTRRSANNRRGVASRIADKPCVRPLSFLVRTEFDLAKMKIHVSLFTLNIEKWFFFFFLLLRGGYPVVSVKSSSTRPEDNFYRTHT